MEKIGIIGSGTWGTAIAVLLRNNGHEVTLWSAIPAEIEEMAKTRTHKNLPGVTLPEGIIYTADLEKAMKDKNLLVMAVPSVFVRSTAQKMKPFCKEGQLIVDVAKGIEENTLDTMTQIIKEELPMAETAVLSGPSHAEEVSRGLPTLCVAGSRKKNVAEYVQSTFISPVFRVYTSPDVLGIETGAALKNVVALAAGIADGLGYGDNAKAALITRGMAEIARLGIAMGGKYQTYTGLSGIGDLIVTCASMHSRNRRAGILIGKGYTMEEAMKEVQMVVEGVYSAKAARSLAKKYNVSMPIVEEVNQVLFEGKPAKEAVADLCSAISASSTAIFRGNRSQNKPCSSLYFSVLRRKKRLCRYKMSPSRIHCNSICEGVFLWIISMYTRISRRGRAERSMWVLWDLCALGNPHLSSGLWSFLCSQTSRTDRKRPRPGMSFPRVLRGRRS